MIPAWSAFAFRADSNGVEHADAVDVVPDKNRCWARRLSVRYGIIDFTSREQGDRLANSSAGSHPVLPAQVSSGESTRTSSSVCKPGEYGHDITSISAVHGRHGICLDAL
jgi:hypothetical protein